MLTRREKSTAGLFNRAPSSAGLGDTAGLPPERVNGGEQSNTGQRGETDRQTDTMDLTEMIPLGAPFTLLHEFSSGFWAQPPLGVFCALFHPPAFNPSLAVSLHPHPLLPRAPGLNTRVWWLRGVSRWMEDGRMCGGRAGGAIKAEKLLNPQSS